MAVLQFALYAFGFLLAFLAGRALITAARGKVIAWWPVTVVLDDHRSNATNYALHIVMNKSAPRFAAILCQERVEWGFKWKRGYLPARFFPPLRRRMELLGQSVEIVVATRYLGTDYDQHLSDTVWQLQHYEQFKGLSADEIRGGLIEALPKAERWVADHAGYVRWAVSHA